MANERSIGTFKKALDKLGNFRTKMQDEIINDVREKKEDEFKAQQSENRKKADNKLAWQTAMRKGRGMEVPEPYVEETPDVPEIDTKVVDLPKEDENEKELIVEHNDTATEPTTEPNDTTVAEPIPQEENAELENFDESEVVDPPEEETSVSAEEIGDVEKPAETETNEEPKIEKPKDPSYEEALAEAQALAQDDLEGFRVPKNWKEWTAKQKADSIKAFLENRKRADNEKPKEPKTPMGNEDILAEAEAIAQEPLPGFRPPANWGDLSFEEKERIVKAYKDTKKVEDHRTKVDNSETNNFEAYKRYPTGLRVAEDLVGAGGDVLEGAGDVAKTKIGGTGANMISERAKGVPHYDYTSLFGRR